MSILKKEKITIIIPCFNEEKAIPLFYDEIDKVSKKMKEDFEFIFINDGSRDKSLEIMKDLAKKDSRVKYISFSRNFGKEGGMYAGFQKATGDYIAVMDVDMQDPPEMIIKMMEIMKQKNVDCVGLYTTSHEGYSFFRKHLTNLWYKIVNKILKSNQKPGVRDFRLMKKNVVETLLSMKEYNRYIKGMYDFIGYETEWISYNAPDRTTGESKYSLIKLMKYAIEGIVSFTTTPLIISAYIGMIFCLIAFIAIIGIIIKTLIFGDPVAGWPSMTCIIIFVSGIQLFFLGIIGTYLSKIYLEVKERPIYIIKETNIK